MKDEKGVTLVELMITLAIFSVVIAGVYAAYVTQIKHGTREYRIAESDMELEIAKSIIERDIATAGYGLADDYGGSFTPTAIGATDDINPGATANPVGGTYPSTGLTHADAIYMMGTAIGRGSRAAQEWSYMVSTTQFRIWNDASEDLRKDDRIIYIEPSQKKILTDAGTWWFKVATTTDSPFSADIGTLIYGVARADLTRPYNIVQYRLGGDAPDIPQMCADRTKNLERVEGESITPILNCVLDFQVAFGLDTNEDGAIECWDNGGAIAAGYNSATLRTRLKQVRAYALVQAGNRDPDYIYSNPDPDPAYAASGKIRVGDLNLTACGGGGVGRDVTLTGIDTQSAQRRYRWRVITFNITPRNLR